MSDPLGKRLGDFEIVRELGRGGMGVVYEARQLSLNRPVALKVLSGALGLTPTAVQRFRREAEAAARLHHTNIVPIYATGDEGGTHFYAMELIEGPSLDRVIQQLRQANGEHPAPDSAAPEEAGALGTTGPYVPGSAAAPTASGSSLSSDGHYFDTIARMVAEVADALDYAHKQGVVHRDVKPANLLLSPAGRLSLNDFGLARLLEQPGMTVSGEFVGTPAYMSPEQVAVGRIPLDHRTDIYSLGATLYELLTLERPYQGQTREQVLAQIVQKEPRAPRKVNRKVPLDLDTICLKCLEKDPDRRYQTAGQLAEDLRRYVSRFAISARRVGPVGRLVKWVRRRPAVAASLACFLVAACAALGFAYMVQRAEQQRVIEQEKAETRLRDEQERARLQLLDEKTHNAYLTATGGDLKLTDQAIKEIEALGASTGQVRLLRGVVAYFRGDAEAAIGELEQAVRLLPDSVAARALLAASYADYGQSERSGQLILEVEQMTPSSSEDYLFKGYAREVYEPSLGLPDLEEGVRRRDSLLGRALRAFVRASRAVDTGNLQDAHEALTDANTARSMLPNNQMVLYASVYAKLVVAGICQEAKLSEQRTAVLQEAARDVQAMEPCIELPGPAFIMSRYFEDIGDMGRALDVGRRSLEKSRSPVAASICASILYRQGRSAEALSCLDQRQQGDLLGDVTRAFLLAELPNGPRLALDQYEELTRKYPQDGLELRFRSDVLLFLGRKEQARASLRGFRAPPGHLAQDWREFNEARRRFGCGEISEEMFLSKAGASRWRQHIALYEAGLSRLGAGDRAGARDRFQKAVSTRAFFLAQYAWSVMFLSRLESDPTWPPWIPVKQDQPKP